MSEHKPLFIIVDSWDEAPTSSSRTVVALKWDFWDDFGFKTSFHARLTVPGQKTLDLGIVKILQIDQEGGRTPIAKSRFGALSEMYCSLGQSLAYYEMLRKLTGVYEGYLTALRDVVFSPSTLESFRSHTGFVNSLTRSSGAVIALEDGPSLFPKTRKLAKTEKDDRLSFAFRTAVGGSDFTLQVRLAVGELKERTAVIIGYNATGKTQLLANLGMIASRKDNDPDTDRTRQRFGHFLGDGPVLSGVIAVSYSAFDTFEIPSTRSGNSTTRAKEDAEGQRGYLYCGLRNTKNKLQSSEESANDFISALERCKSRNLKDRFIRCMSILLEEPSMVEYTAITTLMRADENKCREFYESLSTGHKLVLKVITQLVAYLQRRSLVLFDEPETHLHPSLVAALMKCLRQLLDDTLSFAVIATHSPVVIQETPSKNVFVLHRIGALTKIESPTIETFGENVGLLTSEVFDLNASESDFRHVLRGLADHDFETIDKIFGKPLGMQARSYIRSIQVSK
jgi:predicted ATPase